MILDRLLGLMHRLTGQSVFAELLAPMERMLARVRGAQGLGRTLRMGDFIALGVLRHLQGMGSLREQVQALLHLDPVVTAQPPLARSTWSDALGSPTRLAVLKETRPVLVADAAGPARRDRSPRLDRPPVSLHRQGQAPGAAVLQPKKSSTSLSRADPSSRSGTRQGEIPAMPAPVSTGAGAIPGH